MRKISLLIILLSSSTIYAGSHEDMLSMLNTAKVTGMCGTFKQMAAFQETTKMPNGDAFFMRFYTTEAARLGFTIVEMAENCEAFVKNHVELVKFLKSSK